ncbi:putative Glutamine amidotransferase [Seiridium cardinale]|uniref:glutaminase n=1 Tax=Seiridium cardinale TaxID=138064 RepID=A0ABR2Y9K1_9PEZI
MVLTVGVLALQGGFSEHLVSLRRAATHLHHDVNCIEVRTPEQLSTCDALIVPGGESTTLSLVAQQSGLLQPLRDFVKTKRKPTWGTCAGLIFLSKEASATKRGGQELVGGLDVRVHRNHFGRQKESFVADLDLAFLKDSSASDKSSPFPAVFIRAPVVDKLLTEEVEDKSAQSQNIGNEELPSPAIQRSQGDKATVEVLAVLPGRHASNKAALNGTDALVSPKGDGDIIALRQANVFGTSFHPELTDDVRIHIWWLQQVLQATTPN